MKYRVKINEYEGPLDLLLHLIEDAKIDIYDIPINHITNQYIGYLNEMKSLDLTITSDFILMISTLLEIKSKMLLPKKEEFEEDPREELVHQLIEYRKYKKASLIFKDEMEDYNKRIPKKQEDLSTYEEEELRLDNISLDKLKEAFELVIRKKVMEDIDLDKIERDEYPVDESIEDIKKILTSYEQVNFMEIFEKVYIKEKIISMFLAILELSKNQFIKIIQEENYSEIILVKVG